MGDNQRQYELVLLGASGFTGKIVAEWISAHLPSDLRWAIAGRNAKKLQAVNDGLKRSDPNRKQPGKPLPVTLWPQNSSTIEQFYAFEAMAVGSEYYILS